MNTMLAGGDRDAREDLPAVRPTVSLDRSNPAALAAGRGLDWLLTSGIQAPHGACHAWLDPDSGYAPAYPEVTGYALTTYEWAGGLTAGAPASDPYEGAGRCAQWLSGLLLPEGGIPCLVPDDDAPVRPRPARTESSGFTRKQHRRYTFDAGMVLQGLVAFSRRTGDEPATTAARVLGDWSLAHQVDGRFTPFLANESWQSVPADWSTRPGCHHAKIAIGLLALAELTQQQRYADTALAAVEAGLADQRPDGRFVTNPPADSTGLHPHCYAAEAAWAVGTATGDPRLMEVAARATRWALDVSPPGTVLRVWHPERAEAERSDDVAGESSSHLRADALAQTLRLAALTGVATDDELRGLETTLLTYQERSSDPRQDGGFRFGHSSSGAALPHVNVWVTAFAVQALWLAAFDAQASRPLLDWRLLV